MTSVQWELVHFHRCWLSPFELSKPDPSADPTPPGCLTHVLCPFLLGLRWDTSTTASNDWEGGPTRSDCIAHSWVDNGSLGRVSYCPMYCQSDGVVCTRTINRTSSLVPSQSQVHIQRPGAPGSDGACGWSDLQTLLVLGLSPTIPAR